MLPMPLFLQKQRPSMTRTRDRSVPTSSMSRVANSKAECGARHTDVKRTRSRRATVVDENVADEDMVVSIASIKKRPCSPDDVSQSPLVSRSRPGPKTCAYILCVEMTLSPDYLPYLYTRYCDASRSASLMRYLYQIVSTNLDHS